MKCLNKIVTAFLSLCAMGTMMPVMLTATFIFIPIPAGVLLYLIASNLIQVVQTVVIDKQLVAEEAKSKQKIDDDAVKTDENRAMLLAKKEATLAGIDYNERRIISDLQNAYSRLNAINDELLAVEQEISESNSLLKKYDSLNTQYEADAKRLEFVIEGNINKFNENEEMKNNKINAIGPNVVISIYPPFRFHLFRMLMPPQLLRL